MSTMAVWDPLTIPRLMANAAAANIGLRYSVNGPTFAVSSACSSAAQAIGVGMAMIRSGLVDRAIVGGAEALIWPGPFRVWEAMRVMTPNLCRPSPRTAMAWCWVRALRYSSSNVWTLLRP